MSLIKADSLNVLGVNVLSTSNVSANVGQFGALNVIEQATVGQLVGSVDVPAYVAGPTLSPMSVDTLISLLTSVPFPNTPLYSLSNGTVGQIKIVNYNIATGSSAVAVDTRLTGVGFNNLRLSSRNNSAILLYTAAGWVLLAGNGASVSNVV